MDKTNKDIEEKKKLAESFGLLREASAKQIASLISNFAKMAKPMVIPVATQISQEKNLSQVAFSKDIHHPEVNTAIQKTVSNIIEATVTQACTTGIPPVLPPLPFPNLIGKYVAHEVTPIVIEILTADTAEKKEALVTKGIGVMSKKIGEINPELGKIVNDPRVQALAALAVQGISQVIQEAVKPKATTSLAGTHEQKSLAKRDQEIDAPVQVSILGKPTKDIVVNQENIIHSTTKKSKSTDLDTSHKTIKPK